MTHPILPVVEINSFVNSNTKLIVSYLINDISVNTKERKLTMLPGVPSEILCFLRRFSNFLPPSPQHILHTPYRV